MGAGPLSLVTMTIVLPAAPDASSAWSTSPIAASVWATKSAYVPSPVRPAKGGVGSTGVWGEAYAR